MTGTISIATGLATDGRCKALARGLVQLTPHELTRLYDVLTTAPDRVVVDTVNYDVATDSWCPLAVGLGVPEVAQRRGGVSSNTDARCLILEVGREKHDQFSLNSISGIEGDFFRHDRLADLTVLVKYILQDYDAVRQNHGFESRLSLRV